MLPEGTIIEKHTFDWKILPVISVYLLQSFWKNEIILSKIWNIIVTVEPITTFMSLFWQNHIRVKKYDSNSWECINMQIISDN